MIIEVADKANKMDRNVACIGYFDGVHLGHQALIKKTVELAHKKALKANIITFDPDPVYFIKGDSSHINSKEERYYLFDKFGIDNIVSVNFSKELMNKTADDFVEDLLKEFNIDTLVCGFDFSYGYMGLGKVDSLRKYNNYFKLEVVEEVSFDNKKISSTYIRNLLKEGDIKLINRLLGYEYFKYISILNNIVNFMDKDICLLKDGQYHVMINDIDKIINIEKGIVKTDHKDLKEGIMTFYE